MITENMSQKDFTVNRGSDNKSKTIQRKGCIDIWNGWMVKGARFTSNDIPYCPTTAKVLPKAMITWQEAKTIYNQENRKDKDFFYDAFVNFYIDDVKFDSSNGIWFRPKYALRVLKHFRGVITPDFSTNQDFPEPLKVWNTYRMRAFGYWLGTCGLSVINNVRWGTSETYSYCFDGIPIHDVVCIGTVGGSPKKLKDRKRFEEGLDKLISTLSPHTILVFGSANYPCFDKLKEQGISIISYESPTDRFFKGVSQNE